MKFGGGPSPGGGGRASERRGADRPYKGVRMRKWGKWVAEIREPNKRSRIWLGSYSTAVAAARAYDTAVYHLRGPTARLNFPGEVGPVSAGGEAGELSAAAIRQMAVEVGSRVDALESSREDPGGPTSSWFHHNQIDLNKKPEPEDPNSDSW